MRVSTSVRPRRTRRRVPTERHALPRAQPPLPPQAPSLLMTEALPYSDDAPQLLLAPIAVLLLCVGALHALTRTGEPA